MQEQISEHDMKNSYETANLPVADRFVQAAYDFMSEYLAGETDAVGEPLRSHCIQVAKTVENRFGPAWEQDATRTEYLITAYLHDVAEARNDPEDRKRIIETIRHRFGIRIADAVIAISRMKGEIYREYIERCSNNPIARRVKLCDLEHNMDLSRIEKVRSLTQRDDSLRRRYENAAEILEQKESCG